MTARCANPPARHHPRRRDESLSIRLVEVSCRRRARMSIPAYAGAFDAIARDCVEVVAAGAPAEHEYEGVSSARSLQPSDAEEAPAEPEIISEYAPSAHRQGAVPPMKPHDRAVERHSVGAVDNRPSESAQVGRNVPTPPISTIMFIAVRGAGRELQCRRCHKRGQPHRPTPACSTAPATW